MIGNVRTLRSAVAILAVALCVTVTGCEEEDTSGSNLGPNPTAVPDNATTPFDTPVTFNVTDNDFDDGQIEPATVDLDPLTIGQQTTSVLPGEGTFTVVGGGNVMFTPQTGFSGPSQIQYRVSDNEGRTSNAANITVTVQAPPP